MPFDVDDQAGSKGQKVMAHGILLCLWGIKKTKGQKYSLWPSERSTLFALKVWPNLCHTMAPIHTFCTLKRMASCPIEREFITQISLAPSEARSFPFFSIHAYFDQTRNV